MIDEFFKNLWRWKCGMTEHDITRHNPDLDTLKRTEWSKRFEEFMRNRLIFGGIRYGFLGEDGKVQYDRMKDIVRRVRLYEQTGNDEHLVDIANLAMCEFVEGVYPNKHWGPTDDNVHTEEVKP